MCNKVCAEDGVVKMVVNYDSYTTYDNFTQWTPLAANYTLKLAGVESRSKLGRMFVSQALSGLVMVGMGNCVKSLVQRDRPDGRDDQSLPSGHMATAMLSAYVLNKEYGHKSPWITVGGFACAGITGFSRVKNDRHYLTDVVAGAGIGLVASEIGYFLGNLIFKDKGLNNIERSKNNFDRYRTPSFLGVTFGGVSPTFNVDDMGLKTCSDRGVEESINGAYFFNPYLGVGGKLLLSSMKFEPADQSTTKTDASLDILSTTVGPYFSYPISSRFRIGATGQVGCSWMKETYEEKRSNHGLSYNTGLTLDFRTSEDVSVRLFADYLIIPGQSSVYDETTTTFAYGLGINVDL